MFSYRLFQLYDTGKEVSPEQLQQILTETSTDINTALCEIAVSFHSAQLTAIKLLVNAKADINVHDPKTGKTPLHVAATLLNNKGYIETLHELNADIEATDRLGDTPLLSAARSIYESCFFDDEGQETQEAIDKTLKEQFFAVWDIEPDMRAKNLANQTIRHFAYLSQIDWFLRLSRMVFGGEFNLPDGNGNTLAHYAVLAKKVMKEDLKKTDEANLLAQNKDGKTPLHLAVGDQNEKAVCALLTICSERLTPKKMSALLLAQNNDGDTALHLAMRVTHKHNIRNSLIWFYKKFNIHPDIPNKKGWTPLYIFVDRAHEYSEEASLSLRDLLKTGADHNYALTAEQESNPEKQTPWKLAIRFRLEWMSMVMYGHQTDTPEHWIQKYGFTQEEWECSLQNALWGTGDILIPLPFAAKKQVQTVTHYVGKVRFVETPDNFNLRNKRYPGLLFTWKHDDKSEDSGNSAAPQPFN